MKNFTINFKRAKLVESVHKIKLLVTNLEGKILQSSGNDNDYIYPRSSVKIFQAIPFMYSYNKSSYKFNPRIIALACSSHRGEAYHIRELKNWIKKIGISERRLKCGIHNPLNNKALENLFRSKDHANHLHNNCAGKHLAMISSCLINKHNTNNYLNFNHPHQIRIRNVFEKFINKKIKIKDFGIDGCSAPQYSFKIKDINKMLTNLIKSYNEKFEYSNEVKKLINCVISNPKYIGGTDSLDSAIMSISNKNIFCKGGAEGVFLFIDLKKGITGVIKIIDGNERAIPAIVYNLFNKYKIMNFKELKELEKNYNFQLVNHANIKIGSIETKI